MNRAAIKSARAEARAFIERADAALAELNETEGWNPAEQRRTLMPSDAYYAGTRISGALRRQSLELTRALADLRR